MGSWSHRTVCPQGPFLALPLMSSQPSITPMHFPRLSNETHPALPLGLSSQSQIMNHLPSRHLQTSSPNHQRKENKNPPKWRQIATWPEVSVPSHVVVLVACHWSLPCFHRMPTSSWLWPVMALSRAGMLSKENVIRLWSTKDTWTLGHADMLQVWFGTGTCCKFECFCHGKNGVLRSIVGKFMSWISFFRWQYLDIDGYFILSDHFQCPEWPFSRLQWAPLINLKESVWILYDMLSLWRLSIQMILANPRILSYY